MDPLSALAIAATVVQFSEFCAKLLSRTWDTYKSRTAEGKAVHAGREDEELSRLSEQLSELAQGVSGSLPGQDYIRDNLSTEIDGKLENFHRDCLDIASELQGAISRIRKRPFGRIQEDKIDRHRMAKVWDKKQIASMETRLRKLKERIHSVVLLALWESSKRSRAWELTFSEKLNSMALILQSVDQHHKDTSSQRGLVNRIPSVSVDKVGSDLFKNPKLVHLRNTYKTAGNISRALRPLIQVGETFPLARLREEVEKELSFGDGTARIRQELIEIIWHREWKFHENDPKMHALPGLPNLAMHRVAEIGSEHLCFDGFSARETGISETFRGTYRWVLRPDPPERDHKPKWHDLPKWLASDTHPLYWITGKPGSGKSTIMKLISQSPKTLQHLKSWSGSLPLLVASYYAWAAGRSLQRSWEGLKRTLVYRALRRYPALVPAVTPRRYVLASALGQITDFPRWESWEVEESFRRLLAVCGKSIRMAIFIDGLDEFATPPDVVVSLINDLLPDSGKSVKVCVASRPLVEFDDAFHEQPSLQMHVLTEDDMAFFVRENLNKNRGFREMKGIYPGETEALVEEIVSKAQGVFLWVSLVINSLLTSLTYGDSIAELQATLERLPGDLSSLYDAIWQGIGEKSRREGAWMVKLVKDANRPLPWMIAWLADESRSVQLDAYTYSPEVKQHAHNSLKRRLAARTRGILEVGDERKGTVGFSHRTAHDWAMQPDIWKHMCASCGQQMDTHIALFQAEAMNLTDPYTTAEYSHDELWLKIIKALSQTAQIPESDENDKKLIYALDFFDRQVFELYCREQRAWPELWSINPDKEHWSTKQDLSEVRRGLGNTFLGIAAQFAILPYVREKTKIKSFGLPGMKSTRSSISLLENAIFGFQYFLSPRFPRSYPDDLPPIPPEKRIRVVNVLVERGCEISMVHT
ncbi:hypothetical protein DL768_008867 [Monosporascus sp. mg162]|nr:hypothetical protein DL768_008867 [Monosporascus sp. mg162]